MGKQVRSDTARLLLWGAAIAAPMPLFGGSAAAQQSTVQQSGAQQGASMPVWVAVTPPVPLPGTAPIPGAAQNGGQLAAATAASPGKAPATTLPDLADLLALHPAPTAGKLIVRSAASPLGQRVNPRIETSVVQEAAAGTRLGGGYDSPSQEALTIDPRDSFESFVDSLADPRRSQQ